MRTRTMVWLTAGVLVGCLGMTTAVGVGGWLLWHTRAEHAATAADPTVRVPEIGVRYRVPVGWVRAVSEATGPEFLTSVGPPLPSDSSTPGSSAICAVGEMVPGTHSGQVWDAIERGRYDDDPDVHIGHRTVLGHEATVVDGPVWEYTFIPLDDHGRFVYVLAQWWSLAVQDRADAVAGCEQVLASLQIT